MVAPCGSVNSDKTFSTTSDRNKHEKSKGHDPNDTLGPTSFDTSMKIYTCPVPICSMSSKYDYNNVQHLKRCHEILKKRNVHWQQSMRSVQDNIWEEMEMETFTNFMHLSSQPNYFK